MVFDLDGTLVDTKDLIYASFRHTFEKFKPGYTLSEEELQSFLGPTLKDSFLRYFDASQVDGIIAYYREFNHQYHDDYIKEVPHVKQVLDYLKEQGYDVAVMSNKLKDVVMMGLESAGLTSYFTVVLGGEDVVKPKPDPSGILKACAMIPRSHDDVIYVGDSPTDIEAAKRMGAFSVAFVLDKSRANKCRIHIHVLS